MMRKEMQDEFKARRVAEFYKSWEEHKRVGFAATQEAANKLAEQHGIEPPMLAAVSPPPGNDPTIGDGTLYVGFDNKTEPPAVVAYLAVRAVISLYFNMLVRQDVALGRFSIDGLHKLVEQTRTWVREHFPDLGVSVRYDMGPRE